MAKTEIIDIERVLNGAIFTEYDSKDCSYVSVAEGDNQYDMLGKMIFSEIEHSELCSDKVRLIIKFEEV